MRSLFLACTVIVSLLLSQPSRAQVVALTNTAGITIKTFLTKSDGWAFVTFAESIPELGSCRSVTYGSRVYQSPVWIDGSTTATNRVYNAALAAYLTGKKLQNVLVVTSTDCMLYLIEVAP